MRRTLLSVFLILTGSLLWAQNHALEFDGTNDKITIANNALLNPSNAITLEAWINVAEWDNNIWGDNIISKQSGGPDCGYNLTCGENGKVQFTISSGTGWKDLKTGSVLSLNLWYHVAGVFDGSNMKLYINGILQAEMAVSGTINASPNPLYLGENPEWTNRFFKGKLDEVRIWNVARTQAEISANMETGLTGSESGLVAYYNFNEGSGTQLTDLSPNHFNGTLTNMTDADWVDGFVPSSKDIAVSGIASPTWADKEFIENHPIKIEIKNNSGIDVTGITASYSVNGGASVSEALGDVSIPALSTYIYTFNQKANLSGSNSCEITASVSLDNDLNADNNSITETISKSSELTAFDNQTHNNSYAGQRQKFVSYFPDSLDHISQITLTIDMACPSLGCDPWDQPAQFLIHKDDKVYELARYVTPYGVACGPWTYDITDFRSILKGKVEFESFIQVWGSSGWNITATISLTEGTPEYNKTIVTPLWSSFETVYGDPGISHDLEEQTIHINSNTEKAAVRLTTTGHGQGNTDNAAEFKEVNHHLWVDGVDKFTHHLWKNDCASNSCTGQMGTYAYPRAGWCPGQDIQPQIWNLEGLFTPNSDLKIDYVLEDYTNLLNTGYNGSSHTVPHYKIYAYLVEYYSTLTGIKDYQENSKIFTAYPNPAKESLNIKLDNPANSLVKIRLINVLGQEYLKGAFRGEKHSIQVANYPKGIYFLEIEQEGQREIKKIEIK